MNFLDILQKLLPFTYSKNNETFLGTSGMEGSDWIITIAFIILVGIFAIQLISLLFLSGKRDQVRLNMLLNSIDTSDKSNIDIKIKDLKDSKTESAWNSFKKGLVKNGDDISRVYDADYFFNKSSLVNRVGSNSFASIPSLLLSLGLLGTFIGLFYGLVQLNLDDAETLKESMRTLIHASGAKFASSIWGLGLSVIFGYLARLHEKKLESKIHSIQDKLNHLYPLQLSEQSLINSEEDNKTIIDLLKTYLPNLNKLEKLDKLDQLQKLHKLDELDGLSDALKDINRTLITQRDAIQSLALDISENLQETLANSILNAMSEALKNLESHIGGTSEDTLHYRITQMSGGIGDEFTDQLKEIMNSINQQIGDSIGQDTANLKDAINILNTTLDHFKTNLNEQNTQVSLLISNLENRIIAQSESASTTTRTIAENASKAGTQITEALSPISNSISNLDTLNQQLLNLLDHVTSFNYSTENLKDTAINTNQASTKLSLNVQGLNESQKALISTMKDFSVNLIGSNKNLNELPDQLSNLLDKSNRIITNTQDTYRSLASSHQNLIDKNEQSVKSLENSLTHYHQLSNANISEALSKIDAGLNKNMEQYLQYINSYQEEANNNIEKTLATFDHSLSEFSQNLASAVEELNNSIDGLNDRINRIDRR